MIESDGQKHYDPVSTSGIFNAFYTTVASNLVNKLPSPFNLFGSDFCTNFYRKRGVFSPMFSLSPVSSHKEDLVTF